MEQSQLGLKISELRKQKGLTQEELVEQCNINVRTLQRIESGEVSPRSYTIKTILSALDYDYETLQENYAGTTTKIPPIPAKEAKSIRVLLTIAMVSGILLLITTVFESIGDYYRFDDNAFIYGQWGHFVIKMVVIICNTLFLYGFLISGKLLKNYLMKVAAVLFSIGIFAFYTYDVISIFYGVLNYEVVVLAQSIGLGVLGILFGISILKSGKLLRTNAFAAGGLELATSFCFLLVFLAPVALFLFFPTVILEVVLLYKIITLVKEQA